LTLVVKHRLVPILDVVRNLGRDGGRSRSRSRGRSSGWGGVGGGLGVVLLLLMVGGREGEVTGWAQK
jgi:hypothetical protein